MPACSRWPTSRRDLVAGVIGAIVAIAVLVPVGLSRLQAEQERAAALEHEAAEVRAKLEQHEAHRRALHEAREQVAQLQYARMMSIAHREWANDPVRAKQLQEMLDGDKEPQKK